MEINNNIEYFEQLSNYLPELKNKSCLLFDADQNQLKQFTQITNQVTILASNNEKLDGLKQSNATLKDPKDIESLNQNFDFIYLNSIFKSYSNEDSLKILDSCLKKLNLGGYLFFREACFDKSDKDPKYFIDLCEMKVISVDNAYFALDLVYAKPDKSQLNNESKVSFLYTKIKVGDFHGFKTLQEFLDHKQYTVNGILRYEKIFGEGFVSTGGIETTTKFLKELNLKPNQKVLDVGCGIGGGDFIMSKDYKADVLGVDLSSNMIGVAWSRMKNYGSDLKVQFEIGDVLKQQFPDNTFDLIYSRDTILHISDKKKLFSKFKDWLKPGGKVFISDYCCGEKPWTAEFEEYVKQRGYDLHTPKAYGDIFVQLGFVNVQAKDSTDLFVECLNMELEKMAQIKEDFVKEFSLEDYNYLIDGWKAKLVRCGLGDQRWGTFYCEKPASSS